MGESGEIMEIPRNSKDVLAKHMTGAFPKDSLRVFGIPDVRVVRALSTELDVVEIRQEFTDIVLELDDGRILHLEHQSTKETALYRFLGYDAQLARIFKRPIRTVVLYTEDVTDGPLELDAGSIQYTVENVYLARFDGEHMPEIVERHLTEGSWTDEDRVRLAFALNMHYERITRDEAFEWVLVLTTRIPDKAEQDYIAALILGLSGRNLTTKQEERLMEVLRMTHVVQEIEQKAREEGRIDVAKAMLADGMDLERIARLTRLSIEELERLRRELQN